MKKAKEPTPQNEKVIKGKTEEYFYKYLGNFFLEKIYTNLVLPNDFEGRPYYPDFVYWNKQTNLLIDIEIDEPYESTKKTPIHYDGFDEDRDIVFLSNGWLIVRFTEKQVIKSPVECCQLINSIAQNIFNKEALDNLVIPLEKEKKWTLEEAKEMAKNDYRNSYLPENLQVKEKEIVEEQSINLRTENNYGKDNEVEDDLPF